MLLQFSAKNYMSFKEEFVLSFEPSAGKEHLNNVAEGKYQALKTAALYGANASGKSNVLKALECAVLTVRKAAEMRPEDVMGWVVPFQLDASTEEAPCSFEFQLIAQDGMKYIYGFSVTEQEVWEEYLYYYKTAKPSKLFERKKGEGFSFPKPEGAPLKKLAQVTAPNKLFLAELALAGEERVLPVYDWFLNGFSYNAEVEGIPLYDMKPLLLDETGAYKEFTLKLMKCADLNIDDVEVCFPVPKNVPGWEEVAEVYMVHNVFRDGETIPVRLPLRVESRGTQQLFRLSVLIKHALLYGGVLAVDELDRSMHPFLSQCIIELFHTEETNPNNAQLVFTTHDTSLLTLDVFRRDQIYFTEKDNATGESILFSLDEFSVRKTEDIQNGYLLGRYGAIPYLHAEELL